MTFSTNIQSNLWDKVVSIACFRIPQHKRPTLYENITFTLDMKIVTEKSKT